MPPMPKAAISGILHQCLIQWTSFSQSLSEKLAESGMVLYLTGELEFLQSSMEMNEVLTHKPYVLVCVPMIHIIILFAVCCHVSGDVPPYFAKLCPCEENSACF